MRLTPAVIFLVAAHAHAQEAWSVVNLHPATANASFALAGSGPNQVGYAYIPGQSYNAWIWNGAPGGDKLNPAGASNSLATSSFGGRQGGYATIMGRRRAGTWSGSAASWRDLSPSFANASEVRGLSNTLEVGTVSFGTSSIHASAWAGTAESWVDLNPTNYSNSEARAIRGTQIVGYAAATHTHAGLWSGPTAASWLDLHPANHVNSDAWGTDGVQQVGSVTTLSQGVHAALWSGTAASFIDIAPAGSFTSEAYAVEGGIQVGHVDDHATVWTGAAGSALDINPPNFESSYAQAIWTYNGNTYIAGHGRSGNQDRALLWIRPLPVPCPANCDRSSTAPILSANDFQCFLNKFAEGDPYANCDGTTIPPALNANDFQCFLNQFAAGCP